MDERHPDARHSARDMLAAEPDFVSSSSVPHAPLRFRPNRRVRKYTSSSVSGDELDELISSRDKVTCTHIILPNRVRYFVGMLP